MPRKRANKKTNTFRRYIRKGMSVASTASKALAIAEEVAGLLNTEVKHRMLAPVAVTPLYNNPLLSDIMPSVAQGDGASQRVGDQFRVKGLSIRGHIQQNASATHTWVRVMFFWDRCSNITAGSDVLYDYIGSMLSSVNAPWIERNEDKRGEISLLYDRIYHMEAGINECIPINFSKKYKKGPIVEYSQATTTTTRNHLRCVTISSESVNSPTVTLIPTIWYVDN